jgi:hypothetical protein
MNSGQRKWALLAAAGTITGMAMLLLFQSILIAAGTVATVMMVIIILKHLALALIIGSPLAAVFQSIKPKIRAHCPFANS